MSRRTRSQRARHLAVQPVEDDHDAAVETLLVAVGRGDGAAFERLYDRIAPSVYGVARRVLRDTAQAEEVAQEVLVEIWRSAPRFDPAKGRATSWCLTMAHRRAVDRVRSEESSKRREVRVSAGDRQVADDVDGTVVDGLDRERVGRALGELTELQRQALSLAYYEGRTHTEVAALLDVPLGTVKTRIRDGLIRLRDEMGVTT